MVVCIILLSRQLGVESVNVILHVSSYFLQWWKFMASKIVFAFHKDSVIICSVPSVHGRIFSKKIQRCLAVDGDNHLSEPTVNVFFPARRFQ